MDYKKIYKNVFANPSYSKNHDRKFSCSIIKNYIIDEKSAIDIGSGRGPVLLELMEVMPADHILSCDLENFHDMEVPFEVVDLTIKNDRDKIVEYFDLLTCLDVLEHIEEKYMDDILQFFKRTARKIIIIVANHSDVQKGTELHLIQQPMLWWITLFERYFKIIDSKSIHDDRAYVFVMI
jgi:2-polyprenyl-3-methyl-5-hydroxy-6-metoxy-1,4-benzoquinol methylase